GDTVHTNAESSYLAISALVSRILEQDIYSQKTFDPKALTQGLPKTKMVAENSGTTLMEYNNKFYVSLDGSTWSEYPTK
ncbi:MAG: cellulose biosynthesis protein BcsG, partial [Aliivibrio sp.]|nr:cellulose biosynthesis protein BcsG [Aliivibrio sp.]